MEPGGVIMEPGGVTMEPGGVIMEPGGVFMEPGGVVDVLRLYGFFGFLFSPNGKILPQEIHQSVLHGFPRGAFCRRKSTKVSRREWEIHQSA